jgi:hypothetical protein
VRPHLSALRGPRNAAADGSQEVALKGAYNLFMTASCFMGLAVAVCLSMPSKMDSAIGGKSVAKYHESVYDSKHGLYLYSGGD